MKSAVTVNDRFGAPSRARMFIGAISNRESKSVILSRALLPLQATTKEDNLRYPSDQEHTKRKGRAFGDLALSWCY